MRTYFILEASSGERGWGPGESLLPLAQPFPFFLARLLFPGSPGEAEEIWMRFNEMESTVGLEDGSS